MPTPSELVTSSFSLAQGYAAAAQGHLDSFVTTLNSLLYAPPSISVTWNSITPPALPTLPTTPTLPTIAFTDPGAPSAFSASAPTITIDTFTEAAPTTSFPTAPTVSYGTAPTVPTPATVAVPSAPTLSLPSAPTYLSLSTPTFGGIDMHDAFRANLETIPTLSLVSPTPYSYSLGPQYASALLDALKGTLLSRLAGGTGLNPAVEQAIWDRARDRETQTMNANIAEVQRTAEALGFQLPPGVLAAQLREAQQDYYDKISDLSREAAIDQAKREQDNLKDTIAAGMQLEGSLVDYSFKLEQITFESAKNAADNSVQVYNAQVENFKALLQGYQTYATVYHELINAEVAKVEVYKAQVQAEMSKAEINKTLVEQYKAEIEASLATVEVFKAQVSAAETLVQLEQTKISAAGEQIRAYVAQINAETAKVEAYKAGVDAEASKAQIYKIKADAFAARVSAQAEEARLRLSEFDALARVKTQEWEGYKARVEAERSRMQALSAQASALVDGYKAGAAAVEATATMQTRLWETQIKDYESSQTIAIQAAKINGDFAVATNNARLDATKVGAQVYAQLVSSAYSMIHANAGVQGSTSTSVQYSYGGEVSSDVSPLPSI